VIENVVNWPHLSYVFNAHLTDDDDILARHNSLNGQANSFFCNLPMLDVETRTLCFRYTVAVITVPNCGTLKIIISRIIALHGGKVYEEYGDFHTIRAN